MYEKYIRLTANELHMTLLKRNLHPKEMERIKDEVAALKESQRTQRITRKKYKALWADFVKPLRYEINNAKVGLRYDETNEERVEAFEAYITVMETLLKRMDMYAKSLEVTPIMLAKEKNATGKGSPITNNGAHWSDWIPTRIKTPIADAFAALPHKAKAKRKVPFEYKMTPELFTQHKERLLKATIKELHNAERKVLLNPDDEDLQDQIPQIKRAIRAIEDATNNEHLPYTWHGLIQDVE
jgi:DNA-binding transcriptional regulator GbsR (MarR family)